MSKHIQPTVSMFDGAILRQAILDSFKKLNPGKLIRNPVIFVTEVVALLVTILFVRDLVTGASAFFTGQIAAWLWFTVIFANFAEAVAEGRGRAQADTLRQARTQTVAKRLYDQERKELHAMVSALDLEIGDLVLVEAGDLIPGDGEVVEGIASVNEAAITGESAPVIRESGGDRSAVTGWHDRHLRLARREDHGGIRFLVPGSDDRPRGRGRAAEDAERDCPQCSAGRHDHRVPDCRRDARRVRALLRSGCSGSRSGGSACHPDPDNDRRPALGHRHCRHGSPHPLQCARHVGPCR